MVTLNQERAIVEGCAVAVLRTVGLQAAGGGNLDPRNRLANKRFGALTPLGAWRDLRLGISLLHLIVSHGEK